MILIKNARVMDPESGFDQVTDILLDGKRIRQIGKVDDVSGIEQVIDAARIKLIIFFFISIPPFVN